VRVAKLPVLTPLSASKSCSDDGGGGLIMIAPDQLRKCAMCVYVAADEGPAEDIAKHLNQAAETIEEQAKELEAKDKLVLAIRKYLSTDGYNSNWQELKEALTAYDQTKTFKPGDILNKVYGGAK
jgi:hypothetical protein